MKDDYYYTLKYEQTQPGMFTDYIKDNRTPDGLFIQVMLDLGVFLSCKIEVEIMGDKQEYVVYQGDIVYLLTYFDDKVTSEFVAAITKRTHYYAVFREISMESDNLMTSFEHIFEAYIKKQLGRCCSMEKYVKKYKRLLERYNVLQNEFSNLINEYDNIYCNICVNTNITIDNSLKEVLNENRPSKEYSNFIFSYLESCLAVRNEMYTKNKSVMKYAYLFLITHFFELILKKVIVNKNNSFICVDTKPFTTHDIVKMVCDHETSFLALGLIKTDYDLLLNGLLMLCKYSNQPKDLPQSYKYPMQKDFSTAIITTDLVNMNIDDLKVLVEDHKKLLFIGLIIYLLSEIENLNELIIQLKTGIEDVKLIKVV